MVTTMKDALLFLLHFFAGWVNRGQLEVIEYLKEDSRVLREQLGGRRLRLTDAWGLARLQICSITNLVVLQSGTHHTQHVHVALRPQGPKRASPELSMG